MQSSILGESSDLTLKSRWIFARALYRDAGASLDDVREAVTMMKDIGDAARDEDHGVVEQSLGQGARQGVLRVVGDDRVKALAALFPRHDGVLLRNSFRANSGGARR